MVDDDDRRRYRRIPTRLVAFLRKGSVTPAVTKDVSFGGVFIETSVDYRLQETVQFDLVIPVEGRKEGLRVSIIGTVRWVQITSPQGIGVEIRSMSTADRTSLSRYIKRLAGEEESPGPQQASPPAKPSAE